MYYKKDLKGTHFGHWIVEQYDQEKSDKENKSYWICKCDCGCGLQESKSLIALRQVKVGGCLKVRTSGYSNAAKVCLKCGKEFFPSKLGKRRQYCFDCVPEHIYQGNGADLRKVIKKWALDYKGNTCVCCGYNKCSDALDFHHIKEESKNFSLSDRNIKLNWLEIKEELDKCIVVCSNCHREIHAGVRDISNLIGGDDRHAE